jgi:hypothetical protein
MSIRIGKFEIRFGRRNGFTSSADTVFRFGRIEVLRWEWDLEY